MNEAPLWPGGARGALSLSFDNLGEAAELELGALSAGAPLGDHVTATEVLPTLLGQLAEHEIAVTFFLEGLNAELYPDLLARVAEDGHEIAYHAWRHEQWDGLDAAAQADNLARGMTAFERLGIRLAGLRPPGGQLGAGGVDVLREAGLRYCSPAGSGASEQSGIALLPFQWRHVDASCVLPPLAPAREQMTGSPAPVAPAAFVASLARAIEDLASTGGYLAIVLHPFMLEWLGVDRLGDLLDRVAAAAGRDEIWLARCVDAAEHVLAHSERFAGGTSLDASSWGG